MYSGGLGSIASGPSLAILLRPIDTLAAFIFHMCRYLRRRIVLTNMGLQLTLCGRRKYAKANLCVVDRDHFISLVQGNKTRRKAAPNLPAQVVAQAIAAFNNKNATRLDLGLPAREAAIIPAMTMKGQVFQFLQVPVSANLVTAINAGDFPIEETVVFDHKPDIPRPRPLKRIMEYLDNRRIIFSCYYT